MNPNHVFTEKEFYEEICRFRESFGNKEWWNKTPEQRQACIDGLSFMYLNIVNDDKSLPNQEQINKWAMIFDSTMQEYSRRAVMLGKI